ncbi:hypothetical protein MF672_013555 [Actinomadura sp. ATCC 31491]|uniref:ABC transporter permease n=1 Tax=Actinomadura luzonensis TaxID=2805427 RepID=A0ABT0FR61_9ACTN|nr:hypothetical protein [Actinomadura luzonensis]MCK2214811.1 hypothetical protein [Actinomadura luzonensis]
MDKPPARPRRRPLGWLGVALVLLAAGVWLVGRIAPAPPPGAAGPPSEEPAPPQAAVVLDPPLVPPGAAEVAVTVSCGAGATDATAGSAAFAEPVLLDERAATGGLRGVATLRTGLPAGRYDVWGACGAAGDPAPGPAAGRALLVVEPPRASPTPAPVPRTATTWVSLAEAAPGAWRRHPAAARAVLDRGDLTDRVYELRVTHELRLPADDPDLAALRLGAAASAPTAFVTSRLGDTEAAETNTVYPAAFLPPAIRVEPGSRQAVVTFTGVGYGNYAADGGATFVGIEFTPPDPDAGRLPFSSHQLVVAAHGWTLAGVTGPPPLAQDARSARLDAGGGALRAAFVRDGETASVADYLTDDPVIAARVEEGRDTATGSGEEFQRSDVAPLTRAGTALAWAAAIAGTLLVGMSLARALGRDWWRRRRNRLLAALPAAALVLGLSGAGAARWAGLALLVIGLPVLALRSAGRALGGEGRRPAAVAAWTAVAVSGATLALWAFGVLLGPAAVAWWLAGAAALLTGCALVRPWRRLLPWAVLLLAGSGVLPAGRAVWTGAFPGIAVWTVLLATSFALTACGWLAEVNRRWSAAWTAGGGAAVALSLAVVVYAIFPESWLLRPWTQEAGEEPAATLLPIMLVGLPALVLAMLLLRLRRIGAGGAALTAATAYHTAVLLLLVLRLQPTGGLLVLPVTAWAGVTWLLSRPPPEGAEVSGAEHRLLVRDLIRRRTVRAALTNLLRRPPAEGLEVAAFEERRAALERAADGSARPLDSDLALTTLAGHSPWRNGLAAFGVGILLSLPFSALRVYESLDTWRSTPGQILLAAMTLLTLPALCLVFGYFYPRVRGDDPIAKSLTLLVAAALVELPGYLQTLAAAMSADPGAPTVREALIGMLVALGDIAVVSIGLGLWWEWRLMSLAREPWGRLRNVRSLRALAAPVTAVVIAAGTTVATALVNNVIAPLPQVSAPAQEPSPTASPSP